MSIKISVDLLNLFDRLIQFLNLKKQKRIRQYKKLITPLMIELENVHNDYMNVLNLIRKIIEKGIPQELSNNQRLIVLNKAKEIADKNGAALRTLRVKN